MINIKIAFQRKNDTRTTVIKVCVVIYFSWDNSDLIILNINKSDKIKTNRLSHKGVQKLLSK